VSSSPILEAVGVHKTYHLGQTSVPALRGVDLVVARGDFVVVVGPSGSGKTTLFNLLGTLDEPDAGRIVFDGTPLASLRESERARLRRRQFGFVFQSFNLVPVLSARENVEYPLWIDGVPAADRARRVAQALESVGLGHRMEHRPDHLSGGERQRVSLARALVHDPVVVLADEPTANLDSKTGRAIVDLLARLSVERGTTFLLATHDPAIVEHAQRTVQLSDGQITADVRR